MRLMSSGAISSAWPESWTDFAQRLGHVVGGLAGLANGVHLRGDL